MTGFTVVIIIWVIYQLGVSLLKKGKQQTPRNLSDPLKLPNVRSIREALQGTSPGTWREQLKQALENGPYQKGSLISTEPEKFEETMDYYIETEGTQGAEGIQGIEGTQGAEGTQGTEGTQGNEGIQGTEGTSDYVGILGLEAYKSVEETPSVSSNSRGVRLSLTERELVQGVMWSVILGKPRAMHPFRGPRI